MDRHAATRRLKHLAAHAGIRMRRFPVLDKAVVVRPGQAVCKA
ncbi:hypothetical protein [Micromonospora sp. NPDC048898]